MLDVNQNIVDNLRPDNRTTVMKAWLFALMGAFKWFVDLYQDVYLGGSAAYSAYNAGTTYAAGDRVIYQFAVYESQADSNTGEALTDTDWWVLVVADWIGVAERRLYDSTKLRLEYALNKRYGTTFAQPPSNSDIYITKNTVNIKSFVSFATEEGTSAVYSNRTDNYSFDDTYFTLQYAYTINFPAATYAAVTGGEAAIRQFVDKYNIAGTNYEIDTY